MKNNKPQHTPGPWTVREDQAFTFRIIGPKTKDGLAICGTKEDANLIAAAPDVLEALEQLVSDITQCPEYVGAMKSHGFDIDVIDAIKSARKAIKKAKGEL